MYLFINHGKLNGSGITLDIFLIAYISSNTPTSNAEYIFVILSFEVASNIYVDFLIEYLDNLSPNF